MPTIVVIAKDRDLRDLLRAMLVEQRVAVVAAADPIEAVARIAAMEEVPDAIILDRRIARGAESELVAWVRERSRLADVPIVLFTANGAGGLDAPLSERLRDAFNAHLVVAIVETICHSRPA